MGEVRALIDLGSKFNAMTPFFVAELGVFIRLTSIDAQKIDSFMLKIYGMTIARLLIQDRLGKIRSFDETFLLANTSMA